jgi:NAD(P)-dependent dehydrogenase (short-subunit alcohol dehydrogenase family)
MDLDLAGKVVVVTGASKGTGHACAEAFMREGAKVALVSRSQANLDATLARLRSSAAPMSIAANLTHADEAARMVADVEGALGGNREGGVVPRVGAREVRHRRDRADGRWCRRGDLTGGR